MSCPTGPVELFYQSFGESSIELDVRFWITSESNNHFHTVRSNAIMAIRAAYTREGITIPFPIRTLEFGSKGRDPMEVMARGGDSTGNVRE